MRRREGWSEAKYVMCEKVMVTHVTRGGGRYCVWEGCLDKIIKSYFLSYFISVKVILSEVEGSVRPFMSKHHNLSALGAGQFPAVKGDFLFLRYIFS